MTKRRILWSSFLIALVFTILDGLVHAFYEPLEIYDYPFHFFWIQSPLVNYAISKLLASSALLFIMFYLFAKTSLSKNKQYVWITLILVALLEIRYIFSGHYTTTWHVLNVINHLVTLTIGMVVVKRFGSSE